LAVIAEDAAGNLSASSAVIGVATLPSIAAPTRLLVTEITPTAFNLAWTPSPGPVVAYDVYRNGVLVGSTSTQNLRVIGLPALTAFTLSVVARDATGLTAPAASPLSVNNAADAGYATLPDGMPDFWKLANGFGVTDLLLATADADGDGKSNLQEYQTGTDPNDYYEGREAIVTRLTPAGQLGPEDSLAFRITDAAGTPLVNAPLQFSANPGEHRFVLDGADRPAMSVTGRTNTQGIVTVYLVARDN
jgi:hypothetical protein